MHRTKDKDLCRSLKAILLTGTVSWLFRGSLPPTPSSINRWVNWYSLYGLVGLESEPRRRKPVLPFAHTSGLLQLLIQLSTQELGYQRSRWSTELMALELKRCLRLTLHASTIRRWLPRLGIVWRRAAPTLHIRDPNKEPQMAAINEDLESCSADHPVFYEDEADIHLNSKLGRIFLRGHFY